MVDIKFWVMGYINHIIWCWIIANIILTSIDTQFCALDLNLSFEKMKKWKFKKRFELLDFIKYHFWNFFIMGNISGGLRYFEIILISYFFN